LHEHQLDLVFLGSPQGQTGDDERPAKRDELVQVKVSFHSLLSSFSLASLRSPSIWKSLSFSSLFEGAMRSSTIPAGSFSRQSAEEFCEQRLVRITHRGRAIWLDPFGMLDPQVAVNLLPELRVGMDLGRHENSPTWNVHLLSPPLS
jgi:hypothetical protein